MKRTNGMNRRDFVKAAGAGAASAGLLGTLGSSAVAHAASRVRAGSSAQNHLNMWVMDPTRAPAVQIMADAFKKKTGITVTIDVVPWAQAPAKFAATFQAGTAADVSETYWGEAAFYWDKGMIKDVGGIIKKLGAQNLATANQSLYKGHYTSVPWFLETRVLFYRKDLFAAAGINAPTNWTELESAVKKMVSLGHGGFALPYFKQNFTGQCFWTWLINENPEKPIDIVNSKGKAIVDTTWKKYAIDALTNYTNYWTQKLAPAGALAATADTDLYTLFSLGAASMVIGNGGLITLLNQQNPSMLTGDKVGAVSPPSKTGAPGWSLPGGSVVWIWKHTKVAEAATKWVEFLATPANQIALFKTNATCMPAYKPALKDPYVTSNPLLTALANQLNRVRSAGASLKPLGTNDPRLAVYGGDNDDSLPVIDVVTGGMSPTEAVANWAQTINSVMSGPS